MFFWFFFMPFSYLCCVIVLLETGQIKLITLLLMSPTCSYFKHSFLSRGLCNQTLSSCVKQHRSHLKCVSSALAFVPFEGLCSSKGLIPAATGDVSHVFLHLTCFQDRRESAVKVTLEGVLVCFSCAGKG